MQIRVLSEMTPTEVAEAVGGFSQEYVDHWQRWLDTPSQKRVTEFASILRKWQAVRPEKLRSTREVAKHDPPFLDDLIDWAQPHLGVVEGITLASIHRTGPPQRQALRELWSIFRQLPESGSATCVGISKAILLLTDGRIGPAFDSNVRTQLSIDRIDSPKEWVAVLAEIGSDVRSFEQKWGVPISEAVPPQFRHLEVGRLYDMALGPRESGTGPPS